MPDSVHRWPFVTSVSIDVFSSFSTNITKETRSFASLSDAGAGNKLVGGMVRLWSRERDKQDVRDRRGPNAEVPNTSVFGLQTASPVPRVSRGYRDTLYGERAPSLPLPHPPPCYGGGKGGGTTNRHEHAG